MAIAASGAPAHHAAAEAGRCKVRRSRAADRPGAGAARRPTPSEVDKVHAIPISAGLCDVRVMPSIRLHNVTFAYDGRTPVLHAVELHLAAGWTGIVGANGAGKTTLLGLAAATLAPTAGAVVHDPRGATIRLCRQRVDDPGDEVLDLAAATDRQALRWLRRLELDPSQVERWRTLSAGERKRWQVAAALAAEPDVLALDEPTNHLDARSRSVVIGAIERFRGVGLIVAHDRELLDTLTATTIHVDGGTATAYTGGYSAAHAQREATLAARQSVRDRASAERKRAARTLADARRTAASADSAVSASTRIKGPRDSDGRSMGARNLAAWAAAGAGRTVTRRRRELEAAEAAVEAVPVERARGQTLELAWEPPPRRWLATLDGVTLRAGTRSLARDVRLSLARDARVHVTGDNGAGKSTLLGALLSATAIPAERLLWLPQELRADEGQALAGELAALPAAARGRVGQLAAALGMDPSRALGSGLPSPGEVRKLLIALGLARPLWLVVLDEPTNHLDLPSIERLEHALAAYPGALVLTSHDDRFARRLTTARWHVGGGRVVIDPTDPTGATGGAT